MSYPRGQVQAVLAMLAARGTRRTGIIPRGTPLALENGTPLYVIGFCDRRHLILGATDLQWSGPYHPEEDAVCAVFLAEPENVTTRFTLLDGEWGQLRKTGVSECAFVD
ncbi:MAG: hypothetical protein V1926_05235 [Candidatus Peregrinibacteria bacterium]